MQTNTNRNSKLSGMHVAHLRINSEIVSKTVNDWIAQDPVALYNAVTGRTKNAVILPSEASCSLSLQHPVYKALQAKVKNKSEKLVFQTACRRVKRECKNE